MLVIMGSDWTVVTVVITTAYWRVNKAGRSLDGNRGRRVCLIDRVAKTCDGSIHTTGGTSSDADAPTSLDDGVKYLPVFLKAICLGNSGGLVMMAFCASLLNDVERVNFFGGNGRLGMRTVFLLNVSTIVIAAVVSRCFVTARVCGGILVSDGCFGMFVDGTSVSVGDEVDGALLIKVVTPLEANLAFS